jgi:iron complex transport system substrate-binding protein
MKRSGAEIIVALTFALSLAGGIVKAETMTYTDKLGRVVDIRVPVSRAAIFQTYELVPALDIWDKVVGIGRYAYDNDLMKATRPDIERTIPSAGSGTDVNIEVLLKLKPDAVITWSFKPDTVRFMEAKGLKVIGISPESLAELYEVMRLHGRLFGKEERAAECIAEMEKVFQVVKDKASAIPAESRRKVLWLLGKPTTVSCGAGVSSDLIRLAGGVNPASTIMQASADVSMEQILAWNPDLIFIWGHAGYSAKSILDSPQWRSIKAVSEGKVIKAPMWSTWSPRIAPLVLWMAAKTYPEHFGDIDMERSLEDFFQKLYGISYEKVTKFER